MLHAGGLTYALIWPDAPRRRHEAYRQACQWLIDGFKDLGLALHFGSDPPGAEANNCFAPATVADLVDPGGVKRVGSAQRWQNGRLLQHGEVLLDPPAALWEEVSAPIQSEIDAALHRCEVDYHGCESCCPGHL